jgi:hypothetical protein
VTQEQAFTLMCSACGKRQGVSGPQPQLAVDLMQAAKAVGWEAGLDLDHHRTLVFCSDGCAQKARRRSGAFRLRPVPEEPPCV